MTNPVLYKSLPTKVEVLFLLPLTAGRLQPVTKIFQLDNFEDLLEWRLKYKSTEAIEAKVKPIESIRLTEEEFIERDNARKRLHHRVVTEACRIMRSKRVNTCQMNPKKQSPPNIRLLKFESPALKTHS